MIKVREGSAPDFEDLQKQRSVEDYLEYLNKIKQILLI